MAKTSSSKKVARVARSGASKRRRVRERPKMGFGLAIFVIIVVGALLVFFARTQRIDSASAAEAPTTKDHWHLAYGMYVCDHFLPAFNDQGEDKNGIHTHPGDGIIHTHPFNAASSGTNARLKVFADQIGMKLGKDSITTPDGQTYDSNSKCGDKPAKVYIYRWPEALNPQSTAEVFDKDFSQIRLNHDRGAITFAVVPEGTNPQDVPRPESIQTLNSLSDVGADQSAGGQSPISLPPGVSIPSTPGAPTPGAPTPGAPTASDPTASQPGVSVSTPAAAGNPAAPVVSTPAVSTPAAPAPSTP